MVEMVTRCKPAKNAVVGWLAHERFYRLRLRTKPKQECMELFMDEESGLRSRVGKAAVVVPLLLLSFVHAELPVSNMF